MSIPWRFRQGNRWGRLDLSWKNHWGVFGRTCHFLLFGARGLARPSKAAIRSLTDVVAPVALATFSTASLRRYKLDLFSTSSMLKMNCGGHHVLGEDAIACSSNEHQACSHGFTAWPPGFRLDVEHEHQRRTLCHPTCLSAK